MLFLLAFVVFASAWVALYILVIRPKLVAYRYTAGIYRKLATLELGWRPKILLQLKGAKVAILGFVTSAAPLVAAFYDKISGLDWTQFVTSEKAKLLAAVVTVAGILGPMLMVWLHQGAIAEAAAIEPVK